MELYNGSDWTEQICFLTVSHFPLPHFQWPPVNDSGGHVGGRTTANARTDAGVEASRIFFGRCPEASDRVSGVVFFRSRNVLLLRSLAATTSTGNYMQLPVLRVIRSGGDIPMRVHSEYFCWLLFLQNISHWIRAPSDFNEFVCRPKRNAVGVKFTCLYRYYYCRLLRDRHISV